MKCESAMDVFWKYDPKEYKYKVNRNVYIYLLQLVKMLSYNANRSLFSISNRYHTSICTLRSGSNAPGYKRKGLGRSGLFWVSEFQMKNVKVNTKSTSVSSHRSVTEYQEEINQIRLQKTKIAVFSSQQYVKDFIENPLVSMFPNVNFIEARLDASTARLAQGHHVVNIFVNDVCNKEVLDILKKGGVGLICLRCAGYDRVDVGEANRLGIQIVRVPTYSPQSVAEHAVAHMLALNRSLTHAHERTLQGNYSLNGLVGFEMFNKTAGVIGTGAIGVEVIRILKGIGCNVMAHDVHPKDHVRAMGVPYKSLDEILSTCDIVTLHCPLLPSTYHLINKECIAKMKPGLMLINVSRGGLVDTEALFDGLDDGRIGSVGLDVYENESDLFFVDHTMYDTRTRMRMKTCNRQLNTLMAYPQVLVTPHSAFLTHEALDNIAKTTVENIRKWVCREPLGKNEVVF